MLENIAAFFQAGGNFMYVIVAVLAVAAAVTLERVIFYFVICAGNGRKLVADLAKALNSDNVGEAQALASRKRSPLFVLVNTAIERYATGQSPDDIQEAVEEAAIKEVPRMSLRLNYLALFANVATLLGLLGTIQGLQVSFASLASVEAAKKATLLAQGISQAMNTTAFGLMVAVPCMIAFTMLSNKQQQLVKDLDETVVRVLNYLKKKRA
ncbi:MAG: MotA/TolQ/ExbB proton channel family protein [Chitinivibrionales bacterium]|nr:MotA/TolQ/ExbB proton channel family protein [Chitinivibrionales bacterium]